MSRTSDKNLIKMYKELQEFTGLDMAGCNAFVKKASEYFQKRLPAFSCVSISAFADNCWKLNALGADKIGCAQVSLVVELEDWIDNRQQTIDKFMAYWNKDLI